MAAAHLQAVLGYLEAFSRAASPENALAECERQFDLLQASLTETEFDCSSASEVLVLLDSAAAKLCLSEQQRRQLAQALPTATAEGKPSKPSTKRKRRDQQDFSYAFRYLTRSVWQQLQDPGLRDFKKLDVLSSYLASLGLRCPSEFTAQVVTWYFLLYGSDHVPMNDALAVHKQYLSVKNALQKHARLCPKLPDLPYVVALPSNVGDLDHAWRDRVFAQEAPAAAPFDDEEFRLNAVGVPARMSNKWVRLQLQTLKMRTGKTPVGPCVRSSSEMKFALPRCPSTMDCDSDESPLFLKERRRQPPAALLPPPPLQPSQHAQLQASRAEAMTGQPAATPAASGVPPLSVAEDSKATSSPSAGLLQVCSSEKQSLALPATPLQVSDRPCQPAMQVARGPETAPVLSGAAPATGSLAPDAAPQPGSSASVRGGPAAVLQQKGGEASGRSSVLNAALELQVAMGSKLPKLAAHALEEPKKSTPPTKGQSPKKKKNNKTKKESSATGKKSGKNPTSKPDPRAEAKNKGKSKKKTMEERQHFKPGSAAERAYRKACGVPSSLLQKYKKGCSKCRKRPGCTRSCWLLRHYQV
ncbi:unnamed protein product [Symbiodinium natans]|uniref:Uncharacterized protein n=1 Tax=Symbiodinium natans TaxID=878477 RepID=A0A812J369_9DINO|nr:unnamed protein product [Symbiodinium natans]